VQPPALRVISDDELARITGGASMVEYALLIVAVMPL
jgi:bacteriocin-like protein